MKTFNKTFNSYLDLFLVFFSIIFLVVVFTTDLLTKISIVQEESETCILIERILTDSKHCWDIRGLIDARDNENCS